MALPNLIRTFATLEHRNNTLSGPNNAANGVVVPIAEVVNQEIAAGSIDVAGNDATIVKTTGAQTISGAKTLSGATVVSGTLSASNASITMAALPIYANNAAALSGGLTAGRVYQTAAGTLLITVAA